MESSPALTFAQVPGAPSVPQVNLLPATVIAKRRSGVVKRWLALSLAIVILLVALLAVWAKIEENAANNDLVDAQDRNAALVAEQAQYSEVTVVLRELDSRLEARSFAMSTEVLWSPYLAAISAATPSDASLSNISVTQDTVWTGSQRSADTPLATPGAVGNVSFEGRALNLDVASDWSDALVALPGVVDVELLTLQTADDDGFVYYTVSGTLNLTAEAFANQFATEE